MVLLSPDSFLNQLTRMYSKHRNSGSVFVTTKRSNMKSPKYREKAKEEDYACLVRASDGKNTISTVVTAKDHITFQHSYATILKARMTALKEPAQAKKSKSSKR